MLLVKTSIIQPAAVLLSTTLGIVSGVTTLGHMKWRFDRLSQHKKKKTTLSTDEFFSCDDGYRLQLQLTIDGDISMKEPHVSVELFMCKNGHGSSVQWPMRADVTIGMRHPTNEGLILMSTTNSCVMNRSDWSSIFNFRWSDLVEKGVLLADSVVIVCSM